MVPKIDICEREKKEEKSGRKRGLALMQAGQSQQTSKGSLELKLNLFRIVQVGLRVK